MEGPFESVRGIILRDEGVADYRDVYTEQLRLVEDKKRERLTHDVLILVEHPSVYTYGRKSKDTFAETLPNSFLVERGGEVTYHNPGQLVCYPILALGEKEQDVHLHLRRLERTAIEVLRDFGIAGERRTGETGVWIVGKKKKIVSIGVALSSWISFHGSALNVDNDLSGFSRISPCGYSAEVMTSMKEQLGGKAPAMSEVKESYLRHFCSQFDRRLLV